MGKYERKKPAKARRKKNWILPIVLIIAVLILAAVAMLPGEKEKPSLETAPTERTEAPATPEQDTQTAPEAAPETEVTEPARKELTVESEEQQDTVMAVQTSYGTVKYPFAFSDLIEVTAVNGDSQAALEWYALIGEEKYPIFTITFNGSEGDLIGTMEIEVDRTAEPVHMVFFAADGKLEGSDLNTFYVAQEVVNDVIASLAENEAFAAAQ